MRLEPETILHRPELHALRRSGTAILIDAEGPNWIATDGRGAAILEAFDGTRGVEAVARLHAADRRLSAPKALHEALTMARDGLRQKLLQPEPFVRLPYAGRAAYLETGELQELWLHTNNSCNLECSHCLVSSGPGGDKGLPTDELLGLIDQGRALGVKRFYFTGGEPLLRRDLGRLIAHVLSDPEAELAILTNGILLRGPVLERLKAHDRERLRLQISLDGSTPEINDPIRGAGSYEAIAAGIRNAIGAGLPVTVTTAITSANAADVPAVTRRIAELGGTQHHLLWLHKRGRADGDDAPDETPPVEAVVEVVRRCRAVGDGVGVLIDNHASLKVRLGMPAGVKRDLSNACVASLCVYSDGKVYPSAAMVDIPELCLGDAREAPLETLWRESPVAERFRQASFRDKEICSGCPLRTLCGGGDTEHAYFYGGSLLAHDPYCELHQAMISDALFEIAEERKAVHNNGRSGFTSPVGFAGMGEGAIHCASGEHQEAPEVVTSHSECVLSFELDAPRQEVRKFYGEAAETPQPELCCPVRPNPDDIAHIPQDVIARFYGCGSPVGDAGIAPGEVTVDLGSGAGIDVFICAKKVGPTGRAIGIDMTDRMLEVAHASNVEVASRLGYDVCEFHKGYLEEIPLPDKTASLVTSNCVINLSPDKKLVFREMWRVLKDTGRIVIADIVSDEEVPAYQRRDPRLWGECISGALTEEALLAYLERAGFYGLQLLKKAFWKEVEGHRFYSVTVRGFKLEKSNGCVFSGQYAQYRGPFTAVGDEEGHHFPRGVWVEVCTDTARKLSSAPYAAHFVVAQPGEVAEASVPESAEVCAPGCC